VSTAAVSSTFANTTAAGSGARHEHEVDGVS
jgi:hypothetical protein